MKIGLLTQWYDPETGPAALPAVYAREFVRQGHDVNVLTGFPNYPGGKLYPGYKLAPRRREEASGVRITRVPLYPSHGASPVGRALNYASFALSAATLGASALRASEAIWVYNSPATVALPQLLHSRFGRTPVFLHVQDLWPDSLTESGMLPAGPIGRLLEQLSGSLVKIMENRATLIGVISPSVRELILRRNPRLSAEQLVYVPNPTNEALFRPVEDIRSQLGIVRHPGAPVEFMYAGAIGEVQGLETLLEAASLLRVREDIRITLIGDGIGRRRLEAMRDRQGLNSVTFLGRLPQSKIPERMASADVQLVSLAANEFLRYTTPSKIPSILASGLPILAQLQGDGADLIRRSGAGIVVPPGDPQQLADAMARMADIGSNALEAMGRGGRHFYRQELSAERAAATIASSLNHILL